MSTPKSMAAPRADSPGGAVLSTIYSVHGRDGSEARGGWAYVATWMPVQDEGKVRVRAM